MSKRPYKRPRSTSQRQIVVPQKETKYFDTGINASLTWTGTTWATTEIPCSVYVNSSGTAAAYTYSSLIPSANGSAYGQVDGNKYKIKKLRIRGHIQASLDSTTLEYNKQCRIMLVMDTQCNGTQAQGEDIMQELSSAGPTLYSFQRVAENLGRFRILKDKIIKMDHVTGAGSSPTIAQAYANGQFNFTWKPNKPMPVYIKSGNSTPTVAGLVNTNIFLLFAGNNGSVVDTQSVVAASRCYYID